MKKILFTLLMLAFVSPAFCQEEEQTEVQDKPVKNTFEATTLIDNQTYTFGKHVVSFPLDLAPGTYFYELTASEALLRRKMIIVD